MSGRVAAATRDTFRSLGVRNFRLFFIGQLVSQAGTWTQSVAIIWVVLQLTDDGVALGLVTAAQFLPVLVLGAWGGVVADRVDRHRFLIKTQLAYTAVAVVFSALMFTDHISVPAIYVLSLVFGVITAVDNPSRRTLVTDLVALEDVSNAVALNSALMTASRVVGPALAGLLITTAGARWCFLVNAVSYAAVIAALVRMDRGEMRLGDTIARARGQLRDGLRYVWSTPALRHAMVLMAVVGTLAFEFQVTLPLLAERVFDGGAGAFTTLYSSMSAGSVVGALVIARRRDVDTRFLVLSAFGLAVSMVALALAPNLALAVVAVVPVGAFTIGLVSGSNTVIQLRAEPSMRGRALALTAVVFMGSTPIGGPAAGWVSERFGARAGIAMGAVATALVAAYVLRELAIHPLVVPAGDARAETGSTATS